MDVVDVLVEAQGPVAAAHASGNAAARGRSESRASRAGARPRRRRSHWHRRSRSRAARLSASRAGSRRGRHRPRRARCRPRPGSRDPSRRRRARRECRRETPRSPSGRACRRWSPSRSARMARMAASVSSEPPAMCSSSSVPTIEIAIGEDRLQVFRDRIGAHVARFAGAVAEQGPRGWGGNRRRTPPCGRSPWRCGSPSSARRPCSRARNACR